MSRLFLVCKYRNLYFIITKNTTWFRKHETSCRVKHNYFPTWGFKSKEKTNFFLIFGFFLSPLKINFLSLTPTNPFTCHCSPLDQAILATTSNDKVTSTPFHLWPSRLRPKTASKGIENCLKQHRTSRPARVFIADPATSPPFWLSSCSTLLGGAPSLSPQAWSVPSPDFFCSC